MIPHHIVKPERDIDMNPVDYWNQYGEWSDSLALNKAHSIEASQVIDHEHRRTIATLTDTHMTVLSDNSLKLPVGKTLSKFATLCRCRFDHNYRSAETWIEHQYLNRDIPYIRVGSDYYKILNKKDRYGTIKRELKQWKKDEVKQDIGAKTLNFIQKYDDFIIEPDNKSNTPVIGNYYNLFASFNHKVADRCTPDDIPCSRIIMQHIFGEQIELGFQYMKVLYELPRQALPILCLVSRERDTGKTTFLNWLDMIFGDNFVLIDPSVITNDFNFLYATKNIIALDETVMSEKDNAVERLKAISTQKTIAVNQKHISQYRLPFFAKVIINSNRETKFMKIDSEEIRFWVRKIAPPKHKIVNIEESLWNEIPYLLRYLTDMPAVDTSHSRMVFTKEQISTDYLRAVVDESRSWLYKEMKHLITEWFIQNEGATELLVTPSDIKNRFFLNNHQATISYIVYVLKEEYLLTHQMMQKYTPFYDGVDPYPTKKPGQPYRFEREMFVSQATMDILSSVNQAAFQHP